MLYNMGVEIQKMGSILLSYIGRSVFSPSPHHLTQMLTKFFVTKYVIFTLVSYVFFGDLPLFFFGFFFFRA